MNLAKAMQRDWDERARADAFHYIASWRKDWDAEAFFQSGETDFLRLTDPVLARRGWDARDKVMLELGCGAGRMTRSFALRFQRVYAVDISGEMLRRAQTLLPGVQNVEWLQGNGKDLAPLKGNSVDFAFSYIVLQHMPAPELAFGYLTEMLRVLKPGGLFLFQFNSLRSVSMNWKGRLAWGIIDRIWASGLARASRSTATLLGLQPDLAGKSWRGASLKIPAVIECLRSGGGIVEEMRGEYTAMTWCSGVKLKAEAE